MHTLVYYKAWLVPLYNILTWDFHGDFGKFDVLWDDNPLNLTSMILILDYHAPFMGL